MAQELESFKVAGEIVQKSIISLWAGRDWSLTIEAMQAFDEMQTKEYGLPVGPAYSSRLLDIDMYVGFRKYDRLKNSSDTGRTWPENLSRKEIALCKITMIKTFFNLSTVSNEDSLGDREYNNLSSYTRRMIDDIEKSVYKWQWNKDKPAEKWPGLDPAAAAVLNTLYKCFRKSLLV